MRDDASKLPVSEIVALVESSRHEVLRCKAALDAAKTEEDVFRGYEAMRIAERATRIAGNEAGRQLMISLAWAAESMPQEFEDLMTRAMTGRLKGILQQVQQETKRLDGLIRKQRAAAVELRIAADRMEAAKA